MMFVLHAVAAGITDDAAASRHDRLPFDIHGGSTRDTSKRTARYVVEIPSIDHPIGRHAK